MDEKLNHEEIKTFIKESMEGMYESFMQGLELFSIQHMGKSTFWSGSNSLHWERKAYGEAIFLNTKPHKIPHDFKNQNGNEINKFLESK